MTAELVDEAVNAWYGALKAFALLQPEGLFQEGELGTKLMVTGARMAFLNGVFSSARRADAGAITALLPSREPKSQHHLYEIHTAPQSDLVSAILSADHVVELARLRYFLGK